MSAIHYQIDLENRHQHLFNLAIKINGNCANQLTLCLPAWLPGSYMIRDFAKQVINLSAISSDGHQLTVKHLDKQTWQITDCSENLIISYQIYAFDDSVRTAYLDNNRAFFNGSSVFLNVMEYTEHKHQLTIVNPNQSDWRVATGLQREESTNIYDFGDYFADDYAELIDCPVEISAFKSLEFTASGIPHYLILTGKQYADFDRVKADLIKLCEHHHALFGDIPFNEYWFLCNILPQGFGGLEHKNSTALLCSTFDFPNPQRPEEFSDEYKTFLSLCSHEYFHAWNVCRIKPQELMPYQLDKEQYTEQLWAYEGITSYYDDFSLYRSGIIAFDDYLKLLSKTYSRVNRGSGQTKQSLIESSFFTWNKFYQQGPDAVNNIVSYYTKGALVAVWLDLTIRQANQGKKSLDDLMRALWERYKSGQGTQLQTFVDLATQLCSEQVAVQLKDILYAKEQLDLSAILNQFGVNQQAQPPAIDNLLSSPEQLTPYLGFSFTEVNHGLKVATVLQDSPAEKAGISVGDTLIAMDGLRLTKTNLSKVVSHFSTQQSVKLHLFRTEQLFELTLNFAQAPLHLIKLSVSDEEKAKGWQKVC